MLHIWIDKCKLAGGRLVAGLMEPSRCGLTTVGERCDVLWVAGRGGPADFWYMECDLSAGKRISAELVQMVERYQLDIVAPLLRIALAVEPNS